MKNFIALVGVVATAMVMVYYALIIDWLAALIGCLQLMIIMLMLLAVIAYLNYKEARK